MRLLFDGYWLPGGPPSGKAVVAGILQAWVDQFPEDEVHVVVGAGLGDVPAGVTVHRSRWPLHPLNNLFGLGRVAARIRADVVIGQNFWVRGSVPSFTFVHDVLFLTNPEWFSRRERLYLSLIPAGLRRSTGILTSSETERRRILGQVTRAGAVTAVGLAPAPGLLDADPERPPIDIPSQYLLCVGRLNERKNLRRVIRGFKRARQNGLDVPSLLVVGPNAGLSSGDFSNDSDEVRFLGSLSDAQLRWLYEHASGSVFGSLDEGFGLPPVESVAFGCPVAVSDIPVMREVVGSTAIYFDPLDVEDISRAILVLAGQPRQSPERRTTWNGVVERMRGAVLESL